MSSYPSYPLQVAGSGWSGEPAILRRYEAIYYAGMFCLCSSPKAQYGILYKKNPKRVSLALAKQGGYPYWARDPRLGPLPPRFALCLKYIPIWKCCLGEFIHRAIPPYPPAPKYDLLPYKSSVPVGLLGGVFLTLGAYQGLKWIRYKQANRRFSSLILISY